jgi:hypothetical protein
VTLCSSLASTEPNYLKTAPELFGQGEVFWKESGGTFFATGVSQVARTARLNNFEIGSKCRISGVQDADIIASPVAT